MRRLYDRIHSPTALLAFEAAARHLSFTRAASELNVSQPAISTAVRKVESALGVPLFLRRNRAIELTEAGERFFADVSFGLNHILQSADSLHMQGQPDHVTIACSMAFAHYWLVPRLAKFRADNPDIELRMETSYRDSDLEREGISLGIRRGNGDWPGYGARFLTGERISPVCSPGFLDRNGPIPSVQLLPGHDLIHLEEPFRFRPTWVDYFAAKGVPFRDTGAGLRLNEYALVIQAAIAGQGIAFGWHHLTDPLVAQNLLVHPVSDSYSQVKGFYLVWREIGQLHPKAERVLDWLIADVNQ